MGLNDFFIYRMCLYDFIIRDITIIIEEIATSSFFAIAITVKSGTIEPRGQIIQMGA